MVTRSALNLMSCTIVGALMALAPALVKSQSPTPASQPTQAASVARVSVSVGAAHRIGAAGQAERLTVGTSLIPGDRVRTGPDGVAILVFQDEGRVSIRSDSELLIRQYDIDPGGARTRIELELVRGTIRQISGNASRTQPERYRLNTPIATIGVRGTDFLAKSSGDAVEAFVHEGRIVLTPLAGACSSAACESVLLGSAAGSPMRYVRLSNSGQVETREFKPGELERIFGIETARNGRSTTAVQAALGLDDRGLAGAQWVTDTIFAARGAEPLKVPDVPAREMPPSTGPQLSSSDGSLGAGAATQPALPAGQAGSSSTGAGPDAGGVQLATTSGSANTAPASQPPAAPVTAPTTPTAPTAPMVVQPAPPPVPATVTAAMPSQLVWGRFSSADALPAQFVLPYAQASQGRHVTVGELGQYALWRADPLGRLDPSLAGKAEFALAAAEAVLVQPAGTSSAVVTAATLNVDFDRYTFAATVGLAHQAAGTASIAVSGRMNVEGVFSGTSVTDTVAGAVSKDGKEAGYLFSKEVSAGTFRGVTLWGRK